MLKEVAFTHCGLNKMIDILQVKIFNAFSLTEISLKFAPKGS